MHSTRVIALACIACGLMAAEASDTPQRGIPIATVIAADTDNDGALSQEEWRALLRNHIQQTQPGLSLERLAGADGNGDGRLTRDELRQAMQRGSGPGRGHGPGRAHARRRGPGAGRIWEQGPIPVSDIIAFDTNNDGMLVREEIRAGMQARCPGPGPDGDKRRGPPVGEQGISLEQLRAADSNADGRLDREEFRALMHHSDQ